MSEAGITITLGGKGSQRKRERQYLKWQAMAPYSDLHHSVPIILTSHVANSSALYGGNSIMSERLVPSTAAEVWPLRWCQVVTFDGRSLGCRRWLCVEDDLRDLSILYRSAIVVARCVAEGETRLCASGWWLMCYLSHSLSPIMRVWTLQDKEMEYTAWVSGA